jgi:Domain of unknown function (DUF4397)
MKALRPSRFALPLAVLALGAAPALLNAVPAAAASGTATAYVLQGLPGVMADVSVDGDSAATGVSAKTVVGPLQLSAGRHVIALSSKGTRLVSASVTVKPGTSVDILGFWAAEAPTRPLIAVLPNDLSPVGAAHARVVVTHGIAGPPADIRVNGKVLFRSVANGESVSVVVPAGTYRVAAVPTVGGPPLLPEASLTVKARTLTRAVAIGAPDSPPDVLVHVLRIPGPVSGDRTPSAVHTGGGGQAAALFSGVGTVLAELPRLPYALISAALLLLALALAASLRRVGGTRHAR